MLSDLSGQTQRLYKIGCSQGKQHVSSTRLPRAMDLKVTCVLSVVLVIALSTFAGAAPTRCQCKMEPKERSNCGYPGITAEQCRKAGCCFDSSVPGVPWCFSPKPKKVRKVCPADSRARINCGFPGITAKECEKKGCCFRSHPAGVPWCFYHRVVEEAC
ncbi:trefoil factor 2-like [Neopsephotus bourkii]|uniref:trefoil factor 2-like n=1 Tax=Neopsephotus bourkii TaxID=309878 RepID=UPI002AA561BE|nr:trefoil factor 2-like [Neopsephotus bourkii]